MIFASAWLDDATVITASRDHFVGIWNLDYEDTAQHNWHNKQLPIYYPRTMIRGHRDRVRDMVLNRQHRVSSK